jgi:Ca2+/H+ antiporter
MNNARKTTMASATITSKPTTQYPPTDSQDVPLTTHDRHLSKHDKRFQTKFAFLCTSCTLLLLAVLTLSFSEWRSNDGQQHTRRLDNDEDFTNSRCENIFTETTTPGQRCQFATTCESTGVLLPFVFCAPPSPFLWLFLFSPPLLLVLTLLFRLLGSTADEYFSPSLEMFSMQMGLPPRFAGVTLLALGNGAADVSATINAIASDPENGYKMSLGALTGAAMFITTCIVGAVLVVNEGVRCRGAAVRDVMGLGVTLLVVGFSLGKGEVDRQVGFCLLSL